MANGAKSGDKQYQTMIREGAWDGILRSIRDPETRRSDVREQDMIDALVDLTAVIISGTEDAKNSLALRDKAEAAAKRLRDRASQAREREEAKALFKGVTRERS